jgi:diguanylate cyclase (GGDEF)-like protein
MNPVARPVADNDAMVAAAVEPAADRADGSGMNGDHDADARAVLEEQALVHATRERQRDGANLSAYVIGGAFAAVATLILLAPGRTVLDLDAVLVFVVAYACAARIGFEFGPGSASLSQLVLMPMLVQLPLQVVPIAVGCGLLLSGLGDDELCECTPRERPFVLLGGGWHTVGPVLVLLAAGSPQPDLRHLPVFVVALAAQFVFDGAYALARTWVGLRFPLRRLLTAFAWVVLVDACLSPVALAAGIATRANALASVAVVAPLVVFVGVFARERRTHLERATRLADAYRSSARRARLDPLTGLANRLAWDEALATAGAEVDAGAPAAVLTLDVNGLKRANDLHGHAAGDDLLIAIATTLRAAAQPASIVARLGGDEFAALFVGPAAERCAACEADLRARLLGHPAVHAAPVSASIGWAAAPPLATLAQALAAADERAYAEKRRLGRQRDAHVA